MAAATAGLILWSRQLSTFVTVRRGTVRGVLPDPASLMLSMPFSV
jgi:hypothetical protein